MAKNRILNLEVFTTQDGNGKVRVDEIHVWQWSGGEAKVQQYFAPPSLADTVFNNHVEATVATAQAMLPTGLVEKPR